MGECRIAIIAYSYWVKGPFIRRVHNLEVGTFVGPVITLRVQYVYGQQIQYNTFVGDKRLLRAVVAGMYIFIYLFICAARLHKSK